MATKTKPTKFKVGDILIGLPSNPYILTGPGSIVKVRMVFDATVNVALFKESPGDARHPGRYQVFTVYSKNFRKVTRNENILYKLKYAEAS